jgi:hypothetical protein
MYQYSKHGNAARTAYATRVGQEVCISSARRNIGLTGPLKTQFLIDSPKRLEIAVSRTKQTTEAVSNRMKTRGVYELDSGAALAAVELAEARPIGF